MSQPLQPRTRLPYLMRSEDLINYVGSHAAVGKLLADLAPSSAKRTVSAWGEWVPELRVRQVVEMLPETTAMLVDPETGLTYATLVQQRIEKNGPLRFERARPLLRHMQNKGQADAP